MGSEVSRHAITHMRYNFTLIKNNSIFAFVEYDDQQQFGIIGHFYRTLMDYLKKYRKDVLKTMFAEVSEIPLLRIRYDQLEYAEVMVEDLVDNPQKYLQHHNPFISDANYWKEAVDAATLAEMTISE